MTIVAPSAARESAHALPIPLLAPVTSATYPVKFSDIYTPTDITTQTFPDIKLISIDAIRISK